MRRVPNAGLNAAGAGAQAAGTIKAILNPISPTLLKRMLGAMFLRAAI